VKFPYGDNIIYNSKSEETAGGTKTKFLPGELSYYDFRVKSTNLLVCGDIKIEFYHINSISGNKEKAFHFWFNTSFID